LSPPDESNAIRLPAEVAPAGSITAGECLETPPPFSGDSRPFLTTEEGKESGQSRKQRREAKRTQRAEASAAQPASQPEAAPPKQSDPPPADDDRVIDN
jgi:hypothetical protein